VARYTEGFSHFVASMTAPVASGWSESPGGSRTHWKPPPFTAHTLSGHLHQIFHQLSLWFVILWCVVQKS